MNIAFIGYGNMGSALLNGILASEKKLLDTNIYVFHNKNEKSFQRERCIFKKSGESVEVDFDIIFLYTKPKDIEKSINENSKIFNDNQVIVSIAAGLSSKNIKNFIQKKIFVVRAMPNLCAIFSESITGLFFDELIDNTKKEFIKNIFNSVGHIREIDEDEMHLFTAIFGSGPAYIMYFIESLINSGNFKNIKEEDKSILILHLLNSTSKMLFVSEDIKYLRSQVTSKGGTTEAAIKIFENKKLSKTIKEAVENAAKKSLDLSK